VFCTLIAADTPIRRCFNKLQRVSGLDPRHMYAMDGSCRGWCGGRMSSQGGADIRRRRAGGRATAVSRRGRAAANGVLPVGEPSRHGRQNDDATIELSNVSAKRRPPPPPPPPHAVGYSVLGHFFHASARRYGRRRQHTGGGVKKSILSEHVNKTEKIVDM